MAYRMWDATGTEVSLTNTEDKQWWIKFGTAGEGNFLTMCREKGILEGLADNPAREKGPKYLPEFTYAGHLLDLKGQGTPFFSSSRYGIPARYAVTLNARDVVDVKDKYPDCDIVFWINWVAVKYQQSNSPSIAVDPLHGVWRITPATMFPLVAEAKEHGRLHQYQRRYQGGPNAPESYVLDVRQMENLWLDPANKPLEAIR